MLFLRRSVVGHDGGDQRRPLGVVERRSRRVNCEATVFLSISPEMADVVDGDGCGRCGDVFEAREVSHKVLTSFHSMVLELVSRSAMTHDIAPGVTISSSSRYDEPHRARNRSSPLSRR